MVGYISEDPNFYILTHRHSSVWIRGVSVEMTGQTTTTCIDDLHFMKRFFGGLVHN